MITDDALKVVDTALGKKRLSSVQVIVFRQTWEGQSYSEIAASAGYDFHYIKEVGSGLWRLLSEALGEKVTKHNLQSVLRHYACSPSAKPIEVKTELAQVSAEPCGVTAATLANGTHPVQPQPAVQMAVAELLNAKRASARRRQDWGEAIDTSVFYGRTDELARLQQWLVPDRCRLVTVLGIGGVGKTALSVRLAEQVQPAFDSVIWRSLRNAPPLPQLLTDLILFLSEQQAVGCANSLEQQLNQLMEQLSSARCLLVLDNVESILRSGERAGRYREGYEGYGQLFRRIGDERHQSCLVLTSREKPLGLSTREGCHLPVRSLRLSGIALADGIEILKTTGLGQSELETRQLVEHYTGNPLALKIAATTIQALFGGRVSEFLAQDTVVFGDIWELLEQQFDRLSGLEKQVMHWLAIHREWCSLPDLREDIVPTVSQRQLLEALESLQARSLIETQAGFFSQQPVVMEYITERLVTQFQAEIASQDLELFNSHALIQAQTKDYIRDAQIRFILQPVLEQLFSVFKSPSNLTQHLTQLLAKLQQDRPAQANYAGGNLLNLFCQLQTDLAGYDFSGLTVWQAYLRESSLHGVNFAQARFAKSDFAEAFACLLSVAFSPDGNLLAVGGDAGDIHIWQLPDLQPLFTCQGSTQWLFSVAFSPDSQILAGAGDDRLITLWNARTGERLKTLPGHTNRVWAAVFSPDGQILASGSDDQMIKLWEVQTGRCLRTLEGHQGLVQSVSFSPDGHTLASGGDDCSLRLWDIQTGACLRVLQKPNHVVRSIAFSPDGRILASGSDDSSVELWDAKTGQALNTLRGHRYLVRSIAFSPDGQLLASGSQDQTIRLWEVQSGDCVKTLHGHHSRAWSVAFSPDGQTLASASDDQSFKLWDVRTGQCLRTLRGYNNRIRPVTFSPDGRYLGSGGCDRTVRVWDRQTGQCLKALPGHRQWILSLAFSPDGQILASGSQSIRLWEMQTGQLLKTLQGHTNWIWSLTFSPDGQTLASSSGDKTVKLWDLQTGQSHMTLQGHTSWVWCIAFSPDGQTLASSSEDRSLKLWEVRTGRCLQTWQGHTHGSSSIAFSPDGQILATASDDHTVKLWEVHTGQCFEALKGHTNRVWAIAFSPDGQTLVSGSDDYTLKLWHLATAQCLATLHGHTERISSVAFSPDGQSLASGSQDETIKLWDFKTSQCLKTLSAPKPYQGMNLTGVAGLTAAQTQTLKTLGAVD